MSRGYGWKDETFDFTDVSGIDCLVCHDTTGNYSKMGNSCGYPDKEVDLAAVAKGVGAPGRANCGACHWYGGGDNGVKHGDMDDTLKNPSRAHDVHMGGRDFTCQECHTTTQHRIAGSSTTAAVSEGVVSCTDCHDKKPHNASAPLLSQLNDHCDAIACQTCHIPRFAKAVPTVTLWDWSRGEGAAGQGTEFVPAYAWYNGTHQRHLTGDPANLQGITYLNPPNGSIDDPTAKITPYKLMNGIQPADADYGYLIVPQLFGEGYFKDFDWKAAAEKGMQAAGLRFSGNITFVRTVMHWRLNHEVVPGKSALSCLDCHHPDGVIDFKALGYEGDPVVYGSRFKGKKSVKPR